MRPVVDSRKRELALLKQMPWARGRMEWKGLAARLRSISYIRCVLPGACNGRSVNCLGLLLGPACTPLLALGRLFALSANFLANALAC
jgi:hypothetical protein